MEILPDKSLLKTRMLINAFNDESEDERRYRVVMVLGFISGFFIGGIGIYDLIVGDDRPIYSIFVLIIVGLAFITHSVQLVLFGKPNIPFLIVLVICLHSMFLFGGNAAKAGTLWALAILPLFFYFLGAKRGAITAALLLVVTTIGLNYPPSFIQLSEFTVEFKSRFLMAYAVLACTYYAIEALHYSVRRGLFDAKQELKRLAKTDLLTGLNNRLGFFESVNEVQRDTSKKDNYVLVLIDLDHFKQVNDKYGHAIGDEVLVVVSALIKSCVRSTDVVTRWGGEEIVIFMPETTVKLAQAVAGRICKAVSSHKFEQEDLSITASCGIAVSNSPFQDVGEVVKKADKAMFEAKHRGRNRVVTLGLVT